MGIDLPETEPSPGHDDAYGVDLAPGAIIGEYEIEKKLGHGGTGTVYAAINPTIDRRVAIKILRRDLSRDEGAVARFVREARAVNKIRHPSIVEVFGYGTTEDGRSYLIMELLAGESLAARLAYDRPSVLQGCKILVEITRALEAAHAAGVVHRSIAPKNVFLLDSDRVKLLDFGVAELVEPSEDPDARCDVHALGAVARELVLGKEPSPAADALVAAMLAVDPAQRPSLAGVRELLAQLRPPRVRVAPRAVPVEPPPPVASRRFPVALAATVVLMIGTYATWRVVSGDAPEAAIAPASIVEPTFSESPLEMPVDMTLRSAETVKYSAPVERTATPAARPSAAPTRPAVTKQLPRPAPASVPAPPTTRPTPSADASKPDATSVLAVPPVKTKVDPPPEHPEHPDDPDALKRPTFTRERPVP